MGGCQQLTCADCSCFLPDRVAVVARDEHMGVGRCLKHVCGMLLFHALCRVLPSMLRMQAQVKLLASFGALVAVFS
jgi:hypothetical protein